MPLNLNNARTCLQNFDFKKLFIEELGWSQPASRQVTDLVLGDKTYQYRQIAQLAGVVAFEIDSDDGLIPDAKTRAAVHKEISKHFHENLLIFIDKARTQSLWYWIKRQDKKVLTRDHIYVKGQPGDLFLSKLNAMVFDIRDFDENGNVPVADVTDRLKQALDVERTTKKFYTEFQEQHLAFLEHIKGIDDERDRRWYASVLLNRLMFIYFLQKKFFIDNGDDRYLQNKLAHIQSHGRNLYFEKFLKPLFFEGFALPEENRSTETRKLLGKIKYLNGGLFLLHPIEARWPSIAIFDKAFENLFDLFERYSWNLNDTPGGADNEINPDVLGYIFEKYINQKAFGAYYTRPEITEYLCERTIHRLILDKVNHDGIPGTLKPCHFDSLGDLLLNLDADLCRTLIHTVLPGLRLLDPACGSAAFLVAAMKTLINVYAAVIGKIDFLTDRNLSLWLKHIKTNHPNINYYIKKTIITENLYGVDIMEEAVEIAKLRLFLALVASANTVDDLEPLPNIDFNILPGNSLIGLMRVDEKEFEKRQSGSKGKKASQQKLFKSPEQVSLLDEIGAATYHNILSEKNRLIHNYRHASGYAEDLRALRDNITEHEKKAIITLNEILLSEFSQYKIKFEQAVWDAKKNALGKPVKRSLEIDDIEALKPFHWGFVFDEILNRNGGFDAIITNPPWEIFKPNAKEFFEDHSDLVTKKKMTIKEFEKEQAKLLKVPEIRSAWLENLSNYPHVSAFFRSARQYRNQISIVNGKKAGTDINLYKLFTEQCFNLLRKGGYCGIVIPSGIYTDLGTKQLREMFFNETKVTGLFCFENRKAIFENVDSRFKFVVLSFEKGKTTRQFPAAFMRHNVEELDRFPQEGAIDISVELVSRLSPDSLSVLEFKCELDAIITQKLSKFPLLGETLPDKWRIVLGNEFHMTNDSFLFKTSPGKGRLPLFEGKMIWQFNHRHADPKYWIDEKEARRVLVGSRKKDNGETLDYEDYRLAFREIASSTNERGLISTILPKFVFANHKLMLSTSKGDASKKELVYCSAVLNSFVFDFLIRQRTTTTISMFTFYQLGLPRLTEEDAAFVPITDRAARLICTTSEFDELAKGVGLQSYKDGANDPEERAKLRAELDGLVAHLYGLTEDEFAYILTTFPLVDQSIKDAALNTYREFKPRTEDEELANLISAGENAKVEFKASARWDFKDERVNKALEFVVVKTIAAFGNTEGGTLFIGVDDEGKPVGLDKDLQTLGKKQNLDGYQNWLTTLLLDAFGKDISLLLNIKFFPLNGKDICSINIHKSARPIYVKEGRDENLYVRTGNSTRQLTSREAVEYCKQKFQ